jgi:hypothetical protein
VVAATRLTAGVVVILSPPIPSLIRRSRAVVASLAAFLLLASLATFGTSFSASTLAFCVGYLACITITSCASSVISALTSEGMGTSDYLLLFGANNVAVNLLSAAGTAVWSGLGGNERQLFQAVAAFMLLSGLVVGLVGRGVQFLEVADGPLAGKEAGSVGGGESDSGENLMSGAEDEEEADAPLII